LKKEKIRKYFIEFNSDYKPNMQLINLLDNLSLFQDKILNLQRFMNELSSIVKLNELYNIEYLLDLGKEPENIETIVNIQVWARLAFSNSLKDGNVDKLILSYMIGNYLFLEPLIDFQWDYPNENIIEKLNILLSKIKAETRVPENASFSEKKYYSDYCNSINSNSYKKIFDFFSVIERGRGYDRYFTEFIFALTNIGYKIKPNLISEAIANHEPLVIKMIFNSLEPYKIAMVLKEYNAKLSLPLLIGLINIINTHGNNQYNNSLETDYEFINMASLIVKKISNRTNTENLYKYITDSSNILGNKLWESIFIAFAVQNPVFLDSYINGIDFSYDVGAENVFNTFCNFLVDDTLLDDFSIKIYNKYLDFLLIERSYVQNYCGTHYLRFMIRAVYAISEKSYLKYNEMLKEISSEFERTLYSWNKKQISIVFTKLIFWILALIFYKEQTNTGEMDLSHTITLFTNGKYLDSFNTNVNDINIDYGIFAKFLKNPTAHIFIQLPLSHNSCTNIEFNKVIN
jgi:hypothetical protein